MAPSPVRACLLLACGLAAALPVRARAEPLPPPPSTCAPHAAEAAARSALPAETRAYMASLSGAAPARRGDDGRVAPPRWQEAGLFLRTEPVRIARADDATPVPASASAKTSNGPVANSKGANRSERSELFPLARAESDRMDDVGDAE